MYSCKETKVCGHLVYFDTQGNRQGICGISIELPEHSGDAPPKTNEEGYFEYRFTKPETIVKPEAVKFPSRVTFEERVYKLSDPNLSNLEFEIEEGQQIQLPDIVYEAQSGLVYGTVAFKKGMLAASASEVDLPLQGVQVLLINTSGETLEQHTDNQGGYYFDNLAEGLYRLGLQASLDAEKFGLGKGTLNLTTSQSFFLVRVGQPINKNICYQFTSGAIHGAVFVDKDANQHYFGAEADLPGVKVTLIDAKKSLICTSLTNSDGEYTINVPAGTYTLQFAATVLAEQLFNAIESGNYPEDDRERAKEKLTQILEQYGDEFTLTTSSTHTITVTAGETAIAPPVGYQPEIHAIVGTVTYEDGTPIKGLVVTLADLQNNDIDTRVTDEKGEYIFEDRKGEFIVKFPETPYEGQLLTPQKKTVEVNSIARVNAVYRLFSDGDGSSGGVSVNGGGVQEALFDIASYMPTTQETGRAIVRTSTTSGGTAPLRQIVDDAMASILGRRIRTEDPKAFLSSLNQAFVLDRVNGVTQFKWTPRSYTVQTELGGKLSGAQASIYHRAKTAIDDALPLLSGLAPLLPDYDVQEADAVRSILRTELTELLNELGLEGGPRIQRVDHIFELLKTQLDRLKTVFGLSPDQVITVDEEQNLTNFLVIQDYINGLHQAWKDFRGQFSGIGSKFLGTQLVLLSRSLSVVAESVAEAYRAMDEVALGPAERQTVPIMFPRQIKIGNVTEPLDAQPIFVEELLSWVSRFATEEAPILIQDGGKRGVEAVQPIAKRLHRLVLGATQANVPHIGFSRTRVRRSLLELAIQLGEVERLSRELLAQ